MLAYLGSHDFEDEKGLGQNDGVLARRQPGSALKPFLYARAFDTGACGADILPDVLCPGARLPEVRGAASPDRGAARGRGARA